MRRQINFKFLAWLLVGTVFFAVGTHFLHGFQIKRNAHSLLEAAARAEKEGDLQKAVSYYGRYLGFEAGDSSARARFAITLDELGKKTNKPKSREQALFVMEQVLLRDPERQDLRPRCIEIAMSPYLRRFDVAQQHLKFLLDKSDKSPEKADLEFKLGLCFAGKRDFAQAKDHFVRAIEFAPTELKYYLELATLHQQFLNDPGEARKVLKDMVMEPKNQGNFKAHLERARFLVPLAQDKDALKDAGDALDEARRLEPTDADVLVLSANLEQAQGHIDEARTLLKKGMQIHPEKPGFYVSLIYLEVKQKNIDKALEVAEQACQALPKENSLLITLADLLLDKGKVDEAELRINDLAKSDADKNMVGYLQARKLILRSEWSKAEPILSKVRPFLADKTLLGRANIMAGLCYEKLGNPDQALLVYQESVKNDPLNILARLKVAEAYMALDRLDESIREYQQVQGFAGAPAGIDLALARALMQRNIRLANDKRDWAEVKRYLNRAQKNFPDSVEVVLLLAEVLFQEKGENECRLMLSKVRDARPEHVEVWLALAALAAREAPEKGLAILEEAGKHPEMKDHVNLLLGKMNLISRFPSDLAQKSLAQLENDILADKNKDEKTQERLQSGLASAYLKAQAPKEAARLWKSVALAQPQNLGLRLILCDLALVNKQESEADKWLDDIHKIEGDVGIYWRYGKAFRLYQQAKPKDKESLSPQGRQFLGQARVLLEGAAKLRPSWHAIPALEGLMDDLEGLTERCIEHLQRAVNLGDRRAVIIRRLVELLLERQRYADADQAIRKLIDQEQTLLAAGLGKIAAQSLLFSNEMDRALHLAKESVPQDSENYKDHLWLSKIMWNVGKKKEAKEEIALACKYGPTAPETWETHVYYLTNLGEKKEAEAVLASAKANLSAEQRPLTLAHGYAQIGDNAEAEKQYLLAQKARPGDKAVTKDLAEFYFKTAQLNKAAPILKDFLEEWKSGPEQKAWARRNMAAILADKRDYRDIQKALSLLEENRKDNVDSHADQRIRAVIMASHITYQREAIRLLEELDRVQPLSVPERFILVQLYEATKNQSKQKMNMLTLLTAREGKRPGYYAYYIRLLLRNGELADALAWQKELETLAPLSNEALEIKVRVLQAQGKEDQAAALLKDFAAAKEENLILAVGILERLALTSKKDVYLAPAEALYRQWAAKNPTPKSFLALAQFFGRHQRVGEALDYCEKAYSNDSQDAALSTAVGVLQLNPAARAHGPRVEAWLKKAHQENSLPEWLALLAVFNECQGRYAEAIVFYRQALQKKPGNVMALNNLAWLLALHEKSSEALDFINSALAIEGPIPNLLDTRGVILLTLNKPKEALGDLENAANMSPTASTLLRLAHAQWSSQEFSKAGATCQKAKAAGLTPAMLRPLEKMTLPDGFSAFLRSQGFEIEGR